MRHVTTAWTQPITLPSEPFDAPCWLVIPIAREMLYRAMSGVNQ
jgi:hypothetical protein